MTIPSTISQSSLPTPLEQLKNSVAALFSTNSGPFSLQSYPGFPWADWRKRQDLYQRFQDWYDGIPLQETIQDSETGEQIDKFPIKINPIPNSCEKHASILLGNTLESIRDGGIPIAFSFTNKTPKDRAKIINDVLKKAFIDGGGGTLFASNAQLSQYLGGCVFGAAYRPQDKMKPVQVIIPEPTEFYGIPDGLNMWKLREAWFVRKISPSDAKAYGYQVLDVRNTSVDYWYIEHWTKDQYRISVNELTITLDGVPLEGKNPFGLVPFVCLPHIRIRGFWGNSMITQAIEGVIIEMNLRFTDIGDAVSDDSHDEIFVRGVRNGITPTKLASGRKANNLGASPGLSGNDTQPDALVLKSQSTSAPMLQFGDRLENLYRREARHPAVADGEDEGSQRSSLTLTTRMLPLVQHLKLERINWTMGMIQLIEIILTICNVQNIGGITKDDVDCEPIIKWAPMLPRDREELVNEIAIRSKNHHISERHALELYQDVDDIEVELAEINSDMDKASARALKENQAKANASNPNNPTTVTQPQEQNSFKKETN